MVHVPCPHCQALNGVQPGQNLALVRCWNCGAKLATPTPIEPVAGGALVGAALGALLGGPGGAAIGALIGAVVGGGANGNNQ